MKLTVKKLLLTFKELLVVWINQILYFNHIYPHEVFERFRSFNLMIFKVKNPSFNRYLNGLMEELIKNLIVHRTTNLLELSLIIFNLKSNKIMKNYMINFSDILMIPVKELVVLHEGDLDDAQIRGEDNGDDDEVDDGSAVLNESSLSWDDIYLQCHTLLYEHINELKRHQVTVEDNDLFFKVVVNVPKASTLNTLSWVRLNDDNNQEQADNTDEVPAKPLQPVRFKAIGQINLYLFSFDIHNEYP